MLHPYTFTYTNFDTITQQISVSQDPTVHKLFPQQSKISTYVISFGRKKTDYSWEYNYYQHTMAYWENHKASNALGNILLIHVFPSDGLLDMIKIEYSLCIRNALWETSYWILDI